MHVHMPKPLHGWREFLGEVGIIVVGVSIALVAEQLVEAAHWRHVVSEESEALDEEVKGVWGAMSARMAQQSCIDRRLAELDALFADHDAGRPLHITGPLGRPRVFTGGHTALQIATGDGAISHMPLKRKQNYFDVYQGYDTFAPSAQEERSSWRTLQALNHPKTLSDAEWRELRKAYDAAVDSNVSMKYNLAMKSEGQWLFPFTKFPKWPINREALTLPSVTDLCSPAFRSPSQT